MFHLFDGDDDNLTPFGFVVVVVAIVIGFAVLGVVSAMDDTRIRVRIQISDTTSTTVPGEFS